MPDFYREFSEAVSGAVAAVLSDPLGLTLVLLWAATMLAVGIITSMRWTGRLLRRVFARRTAVRPSGSDTPPPVSAHAIPATPLREAPGPRDW